MLATLAIPRKVERLRKDSRHSGGVISAAVRRGNHRRLGLLRCGCTACSCCDLLRRETCKAGRNSTKEPHQYTLVVHSLTFLTPQMLPICQRCFPNTVQRQGHNLHTEMKASLLVALSGSISDNSPHLINHSWCRFSMSLRCSGRTEPIVM